MPAKSSVLKKWIAVPIGEVKSVLSSLSIAVYNLKLMNA